MQQKNALLKIPVVIAYSSDVHKAMALCEKAAGKAERLIQAPSPVGLPIGFGDSSVDLELQAWIDDPANGVKNVTNGILLNIWDIFHAQGVWRAGNRRCFDRIFSPETGARVSTSGLPQNVSSA